MIQEEYLYYYGIMVFSIMKFSIWHIFIPVVALFAAIGTPDRVIHFLWAGFFSLFPIAIFYFVHKKKSWSDYIFIKNDKVSKHHQITMIIFVLFLGSWIPDIDWLFYMHRSPLTHSVLPFLVMSKFVSSFKTEWDRRLLVFFGFALSSHLVTDIIPGGNVVWLPAWIDMPFLFIME